MKLQINQDTKIKDLQKKFSEVYPFLKIDFYKKGHAEKELSAPKDKIAPERMFSEQSSFLPGSIDINKHRTVAELEKEFFEKFRTGLQVSRKTGNTWIETSATDERTLKMQNQLGKSLSTKQEGISMEEEAES